MRRSTLFTSAMVVAVMVVTTVVTLGGTAGQMAFADTDAGTLVGEGGSFLQPVVNALLTDDTAGLAPIVPSYSNVKLDQSISDFVGSAPGQFTTDYAVTERPLTSSEVSTAKADGRGFAYVPIAATPVAIATLVPDPTKYSGGATINSGEFCQHIPLSTTLLGDLYGFNATTPLLSWNDSRLQCASGSSQTPASINVSVFANADPTVENEAIMALLDSDPTSKALFTAGLSHSQSVTTDPTPSENWPYAKNKIPGGDQPLIGKLLNVSTITNAPDTEAANWQLGGIVALSSVWTGAPLGVAWDLPTAAIQNAMPGAQGTFVAPSTTSATAAENDATLAATSDPTTNNLVTFNASTTDAAAYNNYLMEEDYLLVPTNGLPAAKASKLAQLIRFILGPTGQKTITGFGAAPATAAMVTAGLKVATQLDAEALGTTSSTTGSTGTGSTTPGSSTSTTSAAAGVLTADSGSGSSTSSGSGGGGGATLAFTGGAPWPIGVLGAILAVVAGCCRRWLRRRVLPS
jgi:ABC-type phosphate transport system substrate-binding protein